MKVSRTFLFRFFFLGFAIFTIVGISVLLFLDKYYLVDNSSFKITVVSSKPKTNVKVNLPHDATNVSYSSDGNYLSYFENNNVQVVDLDSGGKSQINADFDRTISFYKWVADRDRIILAEKTTNNKYFYLYYYDVANKSTVQVYSGTGQSVLKIPANGKSDAVTDIQMSPLTNLIFVKMTNSSNTNHFYKLDIMGSGDTISLPYNNIGTINLLQHDAKLIYENLTNNKIYVYKKSSPLTVGGKKYFKILGSDDNDVIYLAESDDSTKTSNVYFGNDSKGWAVDQFNVPVDISNIYVSADGDIFVNDTVDSVVVNISHNTKTKYSGTLVGIYSDGLISLQNNQITRISFAK